MARRLLAGVCSLFLAVLLPAQPSAAGVGAVDPGAAPANVHVSGTGASRVQWSWDAVPGATGYRVALSRSVTMSSPVIRTTPGRWLAFGDLRPDTLYYVVVKATDGSTVSLGTKAVGKTGVVARPRGVHPEGWDGIHWSWAPYAGAAKYLVKMNPGFASWTDAEQHVVTGTTISLGVERDSCARLKVIALDKAGHSISAWSVPGEGCVPYHEV